VTPTSQAKEVPERRDTESLKSRLGKYFQRRPRPKPSPSLVPAPREVIETPAPEPQLEVIPTPQEEE
jgi:hypothetical protein